MTVTGTDTTGARGSAIFSWTVNPASGGGGGPVYTVPLANPGAETGSCSTSGTGNSNVQGWTVTSKPQQVCYGSSGFPTAAECPQLPASPGAAFFGGGDDAKSTITQTVSSQSGFIASGAEPYDLTRWLGGYSSQADNVGLVATFLSSAGTSLGTATVAPVTPAERGSTTGLLGESATGTVPVGTVSVKFTLTFTRSGGTFNDGYADDIGMTLGS